MLEAENLTLFESSLNETTGGEEGLTIVSWRLTLGLEGGSMHNYYSITGFHPGVFAWEGS